MANKIVVRFLDRSILKGTVMEEITPNTEKFTLIELGTGKRFSIDIENLKAIFFVRDFEGQVDVKKKQGFHTTHAFGIKTVVKFQDGEVLYGFSVDYSPYTKGFFILPADAESNNIKTFVPNKSVFEIKLGEDIDKSKYGDVKPKFLKPIVPKVVQITIQVTLGETIAQGAQIKFLDFDQVFTIPPGQGTIVVSLKPGIYNLEITYNNVTIKRQIEASIKNRQIRIDMQQ